MKQQASKSIRPGLKLTWPPGLGQRDTHLVLVERDGREVILAVFPSEPYACTCGERGWEEDGNRTGDYYACMCPTPVMPKTVEQALAMMKSDAFVKQAFQRFRHNNRRGIFVMLRFAKELLEKVGL